MSFEEYLEFLEEYWTLFEPEQQDSTRDVYHHILL